jgi:hypothetical protein
LTYIGSLTAEYFLVPYEFSFQRTTLLDKTGYLFQLNNYSAAVLENATLYIAHPFNVEASSVDGGVRIETEQSVGGTSITLNNLPPKRRINLFVVTADRLVSSYVSLLSKGHSYNIEDKNVIAYSFINYNHIINAAIVFALYCCSPRTTGHGQGLA